MHLQKGDGEPAQKRLDEALAIFRQLGARKDVERTERALHQLEAASPKSVR
jgi:hypothetical protein